MMEVSPSTNVVSLEDRKNRAPSLVEMAKQDPDVMDMLRLIAEFGLREKAAALLTKRIARPRIRKHDFFKN